MADRIMKDCIKVNRLGNVLMRDPQERHAPWRGPKTVEVRGREVTVRTVDGRKILFCDRGNSELKLLWTELRDSNKYDVPEDCYQENWTARLRS